MVGAIYLLYITMWAVVSHVIYIYTVIAQGSDKIPRYTIIKDVGPLFLFFVFRIHCVVMIK
jgi:hypothetical protein